MAQHDPMDEADFKDLFPHPLRRMVANADNPREALIIVQEIREMFREGKGDEVFRAWMIGMNPLLADKNPLLEIIAGNGEAVLTAARAYMQGSVTA